jgi:hypothetical protein
MHRAWEAGITLFETARSYGFGRAEALLSEFLRGRRDQITVITKYLRAGLYAKSAVVSNTLITGPETLTVMECGAATFSPFIDSTMSSREAFLIGNHPFRSACHVSRVTFAS